METLDVIKARRSVRKFKEDSVPKAILEEVLDAARWAPSAHNSQPWKFVVVENPLKDKIADTLRNTADRMPDRVTKAEMWRASKMVKQAPVLITVWSNRIMSSKLESSSDEANFRITRTYEIQSVAAAIQNVLLAAQELGLGTVWIGVVLFVEDKIKELCRAQNELMAIIPIGYPASQPTQPPKRKELTEIVSYLK